MLIKIENGWLKKIPQTIGVYQFLKGREILYIGKAVNLKARLASHLQNARLDPKEEALIAGAKSVKITSVPSEFQALLLEARLIQKHQPRYNRRAKDNKSPLYIHVTTDEYPKVLTIRGQDLAEAKGQFFGPFQSTVVVRDLIREIRKVVPFCTRARLGKTPCFHSKIGQCDPCPNVVASNKSQVARAELKRKYRKNIRQVIRILKGQIEPVTQDLQKQLQTLSTAQKYEEALVVRNRLMRFERLLTQTLGVRDEEPAATNPKEALTRLQDLLSRFYPTNLDGLKRIEAYDISNFQGDQATASMVVLTEGQVDKSQYRKFKIKVGENKSAIRNLGDTGMLAQVVARRFHNPWPRPDLIVVDGGKPQVRAVRSTLSENQGIPVMGIAKAPDRLVVGTQDLSTLRLPVSDPGFNLIRLIRDESHRFSRKYHLFLRQEKLLPRS